MQPAGWANVNSLAADLDELDATLEHVCHLGVAKFFVCSWQSLKSHAPLLETRAVGDPPPCLLN